MSELSELQARAAEYLQQQQYSEAIALYEQSIEANPSVMSNYWQLGLALLLQGQESEAQVTWLSAMAQASSEQVNAWTEELIEVLEAEAVRREAVSDLQVAWVMRQYIREFDPENLNNLVAVIWLSVQMGEFLVEGKEALLEANELLSLGKYKEIKSDRLLQVLEKLNPSDINAGNFIKNSLKCKALIENDNNLVKIKYKYAQEYYYQGIDLMAIGKSWEAVDKFQNALEFDREIPDIHWQLGNTLLKLCQYEGALISFYQALEINRNFEEVREQISIIEPYYSQLKFKKYEFSADLFTENLKIWQENLISWAGFPNLQVLEIGSCEGQSTCWLLDNILTDNSAKITCVDLFFHWYEKIFDSNIIKSGASEKVDKIKGKSQEVLRHLPFNCYDVIYIDGSHVASDILEDAVLSWRLLKLGGLLIFDDYDYVFLRQSSCDSKNSAFSGLSSHPNWNAKVGIDAFLIGFEDKIKMLYKGHQVIVEKTSD